MRAPGGTSGGGDDHVGDARGQILRLVPDVVAREVGDVAADDLGTVGRQRIYDRAGRLGCIDHHYVGLRGGGGGGSGRGGGGGGGGPGCGPGPGPG
ncbi:hypothetical protein CA235_02315 [Sphingomonas sp. ABOLF]|nr:hypothetical protein CA235_02315 [Sphingomonas sp. ABOLF]